MILLQTNHKVDDIVYVVSDCVRRGTVKQVNFTQQDVSGEEFLLSYGILFVGFTFNTTVESTVDFDVSGPGSPLTIGVPAVDPFGSPIPGSPKLNFTIYVAEDADGGDIFTTKSAALTAFGDTLA